MNPNPKNIMESLLFISTEPLTPDKIRSVLTEFSEQEIETAINKLAEEYSSNERGIKIEKTAGGYIFSTNSQHDSWVRRLLRVSKKNKLSPSALETLSTVAYHQPITLAEICAYRGLDASYSLKTLLQKKLVKIVGRKKAPGKPLIYRTSERFLTYFGLDSLKDLPSQEEISKLLEEEQNESSSEPSP
ncbi:MAG: SMC-Scp complex subunit ScpB [Candidatus Aminicenantes bacterium]|nr:SMC-Scp complex subunit ScpB [Candidatus Aminicenantes bacterium]